MTQIIVITGASSGFGALAAHALAKSGHTAYAGMRDTAGRSAPQVEALQAHAAQTGVDLRAVELDVQSEPSVEAAIATILRQGGRLDTVVHNAGHMVFGPAEAFTPEQYAALYDVNVLGTVLVASAAASVMRPAGHGRILMVSSTAGLFGEPTVSAYAASKGAVIALTKTAAQQLGRHNINVNSVCPGVTRTALSDANLKIRAQQEGVSVEEMERRRAEVIPLKRANDPEDIAAMVVFLASPGARNITGQSFNVDGGLIPD